MYFYIYALTHVSKITGLALHMCNLRFHSNSFWRICNFRRETSRQTGLQSKIMQGPAFVVQISSATVKPWHVTLRIRVAGIRVSAAGQAEFACRVYIHIATRPRKSEQRRKNANLSVAMRREYADCALGARKNTSN